MNAPTRIGTAFGKTDGHRPSTARRALLGAIVLTLVAAAPPAAGTSTRIPDQRLVSQEFSPASSHLGATLAMSRGRSLPFALFGAPEAGTGGAVHHFRFLAGSGWTGYQRQPFLPTDTVQPFPLDIESGVGFVGFQDSDLLNAVYEFSSFGALGTAVTGLDTPLLRAVAAAGEVLALGMPEWATNRGLVWILEANDVGGWTLVAGFEGEQPGDRLGSALAARPGLIVAGAPGYGDNGAVYVYVQSTEWIEWQRLDPPPLAQFNAEFGAAVDIDPADSWIAVGAPSADQIVFGGVVPDVGAVVLYENVGIGWQYATLRRPPGGSEDDRFATSVAIHEGALVIGSPGEDGAVGDEGAAYVYLRAESEWSSLPTLHLVDDEAEEHDALGSSVAVGDLGALVGSPNFDGNDVYDQGAVLFYRGIAVLFEDGFESGDLGAWSSATP